MCALSIKTYIIMTKYITNLSYIFISGEWIAIYMFQCVA